jgi:hypothetical protein
VGRANASCCTRSGWPHAGWVAAALAHGPRPLYFRPGGEAARALAARQAAMARVRGAAGRRVLAEQSSQPLGASRRRALAWQGGSAARMLGRQGQGTCGRTSRPTQRPAFSSSSLPIRQALEHLPQTSEVVQAIKSDPLLASLLLVDPSGQPLGSPESERLWLENNFTWPFLYKYLELTQALRFDEGIFDTLFDRVMADVQAEESRVTQLSPILNLELSSEELVLERGVKLRRISQDEIERWLNSFPSTVGSLSKYDLHILQCGLELSFQRPRYASHATEEQEEIRSRLITALRLLSGRKVAIAFIETTRSAPWWTPASWSWPSAGQLPDQPFTLDEAESSHLVALWNRLHTGPNLDALELALRRWAGAVERFQEEDKLIDYWIGLESLFTPDTTTELRFRASLRIAGFLGRTAVERSAIYQDVLLSYDWRSAVVHGVDKKRISSLTKKEPLPSITAKTRAYLRRALLQLLESDECFDPTVIEAQLLQGSASVDAPN